jgi:hypothetical protein
MPPKLLAGHPRNCNTLTQYLLRRRKNAQDLLAKYPQQHQVPVDDPKNCRPSPHGNHRQANCESPTWGFLFSKGSPIPSNKRQHQRKPAMARAKRGLYMFPLPLHNRFHYPFVTPSATSYSGASPEHGTTSDHSAARRPNSTHTHEKFPSSSPQYFATLGFSLPLEISGLSQRAESLMTLQR